MSRLKRPLLVLAFGLVAVAGFTATSDAAQGHYGHGGHATVVVAGGFYAPIYPYWYDPWFAPQWGWYPPYPGPYYAPDASVKLEVKPNQAEVYVDGYYAGVVDDFDGTFQRLQLEEGAHEIEIRGPGLPPLTYDVNVQPGQTVTIHANVR